MKRMSIVVILLISGVLGGCTVIKVVDTAASAAVGVATVATKVTVKGVTTAASVIIPDGDDEESDKEKKKRD